MNILFLLLSLAPAAWADVRLPALIGDHMLIQCDRPVRIWGKAAPGEQVAVQLEAETQSTAADALGRWQVFLNPRPAGGPHTITIRGNNTITVNDVLVGDVWVGSGQSNMQWTLKQSNNAEQEITAATHPRIRLFQVALKAAPAPLDDVEGRWQLCSPDSAPPFSAVLYFFGRHLHQQVKVPMGLIQSAWGGTPAEAWTPLTALSADSALMPVFANWAQIVSGYPAANARYEMARAQWEKDKQGAQPRPPMGPGGPHEPAALYNAMIAPLVPYTIRGAIWYQGETNGSAVRAPLYGRLFSTMILEWRKAWGLGDFPFFFVQLANYEAGPNADWPVLRENQNFALNLAKTGTAVTIDIGNPKDIHPRNKQDVGMRLGLAARAVEYGEKIVYSGPVARSLTPVGSDGLRVWFDHVGGGLKGSLGGFEVSDAKGEWVAATARIDGSTIVVSAPGVTPVAVRYAWSNSPEATLFNVEGLPASPFRLRQ